MNIIRKIYQQRNKRNKNKLSQHGEINKNLLKRILPESPVIVEAGAHIGRDTIEMAKIWPKGHIYAFEPVPDVYNQLIKRTIQYENISCYQKALSDVDGARNIFVSSGTSDASSSLLKPNKHLEFHPSVIFQASELVESVTLDSWASQIGIKTIDFLWLDLQGMELQVLQASPRIMKTLKAIYSEVNLISLYEDTHLYPELKEWLRNEGFKVKKEFLPWKDAGNVLFVRKNS